MGYNNRKAAIILTVFVSQFLFIKKVNCQPINDSLSKYSYNVIGFTLPTGVYYGSGFFLRSNGSIYFITAQHVLTGCNNGILPKKMPTSMNIFLKGCNRIIPIQTTEIRLKTICHISRPDSDYIAIKIDSSYSSCINSIENFLYPPFPKVKQVKIIGYPEWAYKNNPNIFKPFIQAVEIPLPKNDYFFAMCLDSASNLIDSTAGVIDYHTFLKNYDSLGGFSGSPVFIQDSITNRWRVAGVFTGNTRSNIGRIGIEYSLIEAVIKKIDED